MKNLFFVLILVSCVGLAAAATQPPVTVALSSYTVDVTSQTTTFCYAVTSDGPAAISHFGICLYKDWTDQNNGIVSYISPQKCNPDITVGRDPSVSRTPLFYGAKFKCPNPGGNSFSGTFCLTLAGYVAKASSQIFIKAGSNEQVLNLQGPAGCGTNYVPFCTDNNPCTHDYFTYSNGVAVCHHDVVCECTCDTDCVDTNLCTIDTCNLGNCHHYPKNCEDTNICTTDSCNPATGLCVHSYNSLPCNDYNACTSGDVCCSGVCSGNPTVCNDGNICTGNALGLDTCDPVTGQCVYTANTNNCNDNNACTTGDVCCNGVCAGHPVVCNDGNICTGNALGVDTCNPTTGLCVYTANSNPCSDGNLCTTNDVCSNGHCTGSPVVCTDGDVCTGTGPLGVDTCDPATGTCIYAANVNSCNDGNPCTVNDVCCNGECAGTPVVCNDGNICTGNALGIDTCNPTTGLCVYSANTNTCDDGNLCTTNDVCSNGACHGTPKVCDDHNLCTGNAQGVDTCNPTTGQCVYSANTNPCNDGNSCTTGDVCCNGVCNGVGIVCNDNNICTGNAQGADTCVNGVCVYSYNNNPCNDGNPCTSNDVCANGVCHGTPVVCNDGNICTGNAQGVDTCNPTTGACVYTYNTNYCNDGNPCTLNDVCCNGVCSGTGKVCNDGNICTGNAQGVDSCDPLTGHCVTTYNTNSCNDGNLCTTNDVCANGVCHGTPIVCNDGNICTGNTQGVDTCNLATGQCVYSYNSNLCNDNDGCTVNDVCSGGACHGTPRVCTDGDVCTGNSITGVDPCVNGQCVYNVLNTNDCDDLDPCTTGDTCINGDCSGTPVCPNPALSVPVYADVHWKSAQLTVFATSTLFVIHWHAEPGWTSNHFDVFVGTSAPTMDYAHYPFHLTLANYVSDALLVIPLSTLSQLLHITVTCDSDLYFAFHSTTHNDGTAACIPLYGCPGTTEDSWAFGPYAFTDCDGWYSHVDLCCCFDYVHVTGLDCNLGTPLVYG